MQSRSIKPPRVPLYDFPDVLIHADESEVRSHEYYDAAKAGNFVAAEQLITAFDHGFIERIGSKIDGRAVELVAVHALESTGVNEIPAALARRMSHWLHLPVNDSIVQSNSVGHTKASGFHRLAHQAQFFGPVTLAQPYLIVDDFVGQGGTLANLIGHIKVHGGEVFGATVLTGKPHSAKLAPDEVLIQSVRSKHGYEFEEWWRERFGFGFDCLTRSEARYLEKSPDANTIRNRLVAAGLEGGA